MILIDHSPPSVGCRVESRSDRAQRGRVRALSSDGQAALVEWDAVRGSAAQAAALVLRSSWRVTSDLRRVDTLTRPQLTLRWARRRVRGN